MLSRYSLLVVALCAMVLAVGCAVDTGGISGGSDPDGPISANDQSVVREGTTGAQLFSMMALMSVRLHRAATTVNDGPPAAPSTRAVDATSLEDELQAVFGETNVSVTPTGISSFNVTFTDASLTGLTTINGTVAVAFTLSASSVEASITTSDLTVGPFTVQTTQAIEVTANNEGESISGAISATRGVRDWNVAFSGSADDNSIQGTMTVTVAERTLSVTASWTDATVGGQEVDTMALSISYGIPPTTLTVAINWTGDTTTAVITKNNDTRTIDWKTYEV